MSAYTVPIPTGQMCIYCDYFHLRSFDIWLNIWMLNCASQISSSFLCVWEMAHQTTSQFIFFKLLRSIFLFFVIPECSWLTTWRCACVVSSMFPVECMTSSSTVEHYRLSASLICLSHMDTCAWVTHISLTMASHFSTDLQVAVVYQKDAEIHQQKEGKKTKCMFQNIKKKMVLQIVLRKEMKSTNLSVYIMHFVNTECKLLFPRKLPRAPFNNMMSLYCGQRTVWH